MSGKISGGLVKRETNFCWIIRQPHYLLAIQQTEKLKIVNLMITARFKYNISFKLDLSWQALGPEQLL